MVKYLPFVKHFIPFTVSILLMLLIVKPGISYGQIQVSNSLSVQTLVNDYFAGDGVIISNISYTGQPVSLGGFTNGSTTNIGMDAGIIASTGKVIDIVGPNNWPNTQTNTLGGSDPQLAALLPGYSINDAAAIEFNFIPLGDTLHFRYVFASEEYPEWIGSGYNDVVGFFLSGPNPAGGTYNNKNLAIVPGTTNTPVTITSINNGTTNSGPCVNCQYYVNNVGGLTIEFDGFTTVLTAWALVTPCASYHIKLAIGDGNDHSYDSGVFLEKGSFSTNVIRPDVTYTTPGMNVSAVEGCNNAVVSFTLDKPSQSGQWITYSIGGSATNGVDFPAIPDSMYLAAGVDSVGFTIAPIADGITEGVENVELIIKIASCYYDTLSIPISDYTPVDIHISGDSAFCFGDSTTLTANIMDGFAPYQLLWNTNDTNQQIHIAPATSGNYTVSITDGCGSTNSDTALVSVYSLPNFIISVSEDSICPGDSTLLVISGGANYIWAPTASISPNTGDSIYAFPNTPTTYTAIGVDSNSCRDTAQITINLKTLPTIQLSPKLDTICRNDSTQIIASGGISYQWTPTGGLSNPNASSVYASPTNTTIYIVKGMGANSCFNYDTTNIIVESIPNVSIAPANPLICQGDSVTLTASGAVNYIWNPATGLSSTNTASTIASPGSTITYFVEGTGANNCSNKDTVTVTVAPLPSISINPSSAFICQNDSALLVVSGAQTYTWNPGINPVNSNADSVYASPAVNTTYTVIGTDSNTCIATDSVSVSVSPSTYISTNDSVLCIGDTTTLTANIPLSNVSYYWSNNGATTQSISINPTSTSFYHVLVTSSNGCTAEDSMEIIVNPQPNLVVSPNPVSLCLGDSASVTASGAQTYSWTPLTNNSNPNSATTILSPSVSSVYTVIGSDANSCLDTVSVAVNVHNLPVVSVSPKYDTICVNGITTLNASGALTYSWAPASGLSATTGASVTASPATPTSYIVSGTDSNSCVGTDTTSVFVSPVLVVTANPNAVCMGDSVLLSVTSNVPASFLWNTGNTTSSFWVVVNTTTTFSVTATTADGCTNTESVTVQVYVAPTIDITPDSSTICKGNSITLTASGGQTYSWVPNPALSSLTGATVVASPTVNSTFYVVGTDQWGCWNLDSAKVYLDSSLVVSVVPANASICYGDSVELTATGTTNIPGAITYAWSPSGSLNTSTGDTVMAKPGSTQVYQVVGTASNACTDTAYSTISVHANPNLSVNPNSTYICKGDSILITASGATSYFWYPSNGLSSNNQNQTYASPIVNTTYTIVGQNQFGCKDSTTSSIGVEPYPVLSINHPSYHLCPGDSVLLSVNGANTYIWSPAIGLSGTGGTQNYAGPDSSQVYSIIGSSPHGCSDTVTSNITVSPIPVITGVDTICKGDTVTLTAYSNDPNTTFSWSNGASGSVISVSPYKTTTYQVTATANGCSNDTSFTITVDSVETPVISPVNPSICPGDSVLLKVITPYTSPSYSWNTGATSDSLFVMPVSTTTYTVTVSLPNSCSNSNSVMVEVYNDPNVAASTSTPLICKGDTAYLAAANCVSYSWTGNNLLNLTGPVVAALPNMSSTYVVTALSVHNCVSKDSVNVSIYPTAQINVTASQNVICDNDTSYLTASGASTYTWSPNSFISSTNGSSVAVYPPNSQIYSVAGINQDGCKDTTSILITVNHGPTVTIFPDSPLVCQGDTMLLVASGAVSYVWTPLTSLIGSPNDSVWIHPTANTIYYVTGTDSIGCTGDTSVYVNVRRKPFISVIPVIDSICDGDSVNLLAHGAITYHWTPHNTLSDSVGVSVTATPSATTTYTVVGTSSDGCYKSATATIHVYPNPVMQISPAIDSICFGDSLLITVNGANNYQWSPTTALQLNSTADTALSKPGQSITYRVIGDNQYGCIDSVFSSITVNSLPTISITANDTIMCDRDSTLISVSGANTYFWTPATGLSSNTGSSNYCSSSNTITYHITGYDTNNCIDDDSIKIEVLPSPTINVSASDTLICSGDFISLTGSSTSANTSFLWSNGATTAVTSDTPTSNTTYKLVGTDPNSCKDSAEVFVQVNPYPVLSLIPQNAVLCYSDTLTINSNCNLTNLNYLWSNGSNTTSISVNPLVDSVFTLIVSDSIGCSDTASSFVNVVPNPTVYITATDTHICANAPTTLSANASTPQVTYLWNIGNPTQSNTYYPSVSSTYTVLVTDTNNCTASDSLFILVNNQPQLQISSNPNSICIGDTAILSVTSNIPTLSYLWSTGATTSSIIAAPGTTTNYTVTGTDSLGCNDSASYSLVVHMLPQLSISPNPAEICRNDSITLTLNSNIPIAQYQWSNSSTQNSISVSPATTTTYSVIATDTNSCVDSTSRIVVVHDNPIVSISPQGDTICSGDSIQLFTSYNVGQAQILWNTGATIDNPFFAPMTTTSYSVIVTDSNTCKGYDTSLVNVTPTPTCTLTALSPICSDDSSLIQYSGTATAAAISNWFFDGGNVLSGSGIAPHYVQWTNQGTYYVTLSVMENNCTSKTDTAEITVFETPKIQISVLDSTVCDSLPVYFSSLPSGMAHYQWSFGDPVAIGKDTSTLQNPSYIYHFPGTYDISLTVTSTDGCSAYMHKNAMVEIYPTIDAQFILNPAISYDHDPLISFTDQSTGASSWQWDFDDAMGGSSNTSNLQNPFHVYNNPGTYQPVLIAMNSYGCTDTAVRVVEIHEPIAFYVPNAFTPNGDGINDYFQPKGANFDESSYQIFIYNRWGEVVFHSNDFNDLWDGTFQKTGTKAPVGVYSYIIKLTTNEGVKKKYLGTITLIR